MAGFGGQDNNGPPKNRPPHNPRNCGCIRLHDKRAIEDVILDPEVRRLRISQGLKQ